MISMEEYLSWYHDVIVQGYDDVNPRQTFMEALKLAPHYRARIQPEQFQPVVKLYEAYRSTIEQRLARYDGSGWRAFAPSIRKGIPKRIDTRAQTILKPLRDQY